MITNLEVDIVTVSIIQFTICRLAIGKNYQQFKRIKIEGEGRDFHSFFFNLQCDASLARLW
jgi:hypothetical protein